MNRSRANRRILLLVGIGLVLLLGGVVGKLGPLHWVFDRTIGPIAQGFSNVGMTTGEVVSNLSQVSALARTNAALTRENDDLRQRLAADAETRSDNELLRRQLGLEVAGGPR